MKSTLSTVACILISTCCLLGGERAKTGIGVGALPRVGFDADNGFNAGVQVNVNNYGDGGIYPNPYSNFYLDASYYQKGIVNLIASYDNRNLIPSARLCSAVQFTDDHGFNFWGLNGYQSNYIADAGIYALHHKKLNFKVDAVGNITPHLGWEAGYHCLWVNCSEREDAAGSLFTLYNKWGIIPRDQLGGGINSELRIGLVYDTRDAEASPSRGIWAEGHLIGAPAFLGTKVPYSKFCLNWRHYVPLYRDRLTFAYRVAWQGILGDSAPWYILPYYTVVGPQFDRDGIGGRMTLRGIMQNRIEGLQSVFFNTELRWRFFDFRLFNQDVSMCASTFFEGGKAVVPYDISYGSHCEATATEEERLLYSKYIDTSEPDRMHLSAGAGIRAIFNRNFIITCEWGKALNATDNRFGNKMQDAGAGTAFYFTTGFTF